MHPRARRWLVLGVLLWLGPGLALACGGGSPSSGGSAAGGAGAPPPAGQTVTLGTGLTGSLTGSSSNQAVVIISESGGEAAWQPVAAGLARSGYRVLLYTRPDRGGEEAARLAATALTQRGVEKLAFVGSRQGSADALAAAGDAAGVVLVNPSATPDPAPAAGLPPTALLVIASLADAAGSAVARRLYAAASEPRELVLHPAPPSGIIALLSPAALNATPPAGGSDVHTVFLAFLRRAFAPRNA